MAKEVTRDQAQRKKAQAAAFSALDILRGEDEEADDEEDADEVDGDEDDDYQD
jgi:hypothetical protein